MGSRCKLVTDTGDFKVELDSFEGHCKQLKRILNSSYKTPLKWSLTAIVIIIVHFLIWIIFAIFWFILSYKAQTCISPLASFTEALSFSIHMQTRIGYAGKELNPDCLLAVCMLLLQSIIGLIWHILVLVVVSKSAINLLNSRVKFNKITLEDNLIFYQVTDKLSDKTNKTIANVSARRESIAAGRRGSVVAYRKASIFGRRASRAEGHRFNRQKTGKSGRYEKLKTKKAAKEAPKSGSEVFKIVVGMEGDDDGVILLGMHAFLLVKKKVKTALMDFLEVLATRDIKFLKEENVEIEDNEARQLVHMIDDNSAMKQFMEFIFKKKKWKKQAEQEATKSDVATETEHIALWPDESISVSKMELEVVVVLQYQPTNSNSLSETRKSFALSDFRFYNPQEFID